MVTRQRGTETAEKSAFLNMSAALGLTGKDLGRKSSRASHSAWKRKTEKIQNMGREMVGIHMKIVLSCPGYVSDWLPAGSWDLQRLMSALFILFSKLQSLFAISFTSPVCIDT